MSDVAGRLESLECTQRELVGVVRGIGDVLALRQHNRELVDEIATLRLEAQQQGGLVKELREANSALEAKAARAKFTPVLKGRAWEEACEADLRTLFPAVRDTHAQPHSGDFLIRIPYWPHADGEVKILVDAKSGERAPDAKQWDKLSDDMQTQDAQFGVLLCNTKERVLDPRIRMLDARNATGRPTDNLAPGRLIGCNRDGLTQAICLLLVRNVGSDARLDADAVHRRALCVGFMQAASKLFRPFLASSPTAQEYAVLTKRLHDICRTGHALDVDLFPEPVSWQKRHRPETGPVADARS
jgi:hypothetical protein